MNDSRVDINKANNRGWTPFSIACFEGQIEIIQLLLKDERIDISKANGYSETPLHIASYKGYTELLENLLSSGKDVNLTAKDFDEKTAIDVARGRIDEERDEDMETEEQYQKRIRNYPKIIELLESFERNPNETRMRLRKQLEYD